MSASALSVLIRAMRRRVTTQQVLRGACLGLTLAALFELLVLVVPTSMDLEALVTVSTLERVVRALVMVAAGVGIMLVGTHHQRAEGALVSLIERTLPSSRNLLFTAWELARSTSAAVPSTPAEAQQMVLARAGQLASGTRAEELLPLATQWRQLGFATAVWCLATVLGHMLPAGAIGRTVNRTVKQGIAAVTGSASISGVDVRVIEPSYAGRAPRVEREPSRIAALEGSLVEIDIMTTATEMVITTDSGEVVLPRPADGLFRWQGRIVRDGFIALSTRQNSGDATSTSDVRTISIVSQPDAAPVAQIVEPGRDLIVDSTRRTLTVRIDASDDLALRSLELAFTKVSGSGERFTFSEGVATSRIERLSATHWNANAVLPLDSLLTKAGDLVVYRARVADARPGAAPVESDAFIAERLPDGGLAAAGFSLDPDEDRYAVSQQMVILKTERLIAARASLPAATLAEQARALGSEQQRVRAEFVFMTGGEFEQALVADEDGMADLDETHEAESEADLAAGRMVNRGRAALMTAIRAMSRAALALNTADLTNALRHERTALENLQEAFARQRFLMRALSQREQLDLSRRLTGSMDSVSRAPRALLPASADVLRERVRDVLSALNSGNGNGSGNASFMRGLSVRVLQLEPGSERAAQIASLLREGKRDDAALLLTQWLASLTPGGAAHVRSADWRAVDAAVSGFSQRPPR